MPPPRPSRPVGFLLLGMVLILVGLVCTAAAVAGPDDDVSLRAVCGLIALLSLVLVEALWWVRPWVARAADAWAAGCVAATMADAVWHGSTLENLVGITIVALLCAAVRWYVRDRARKLGLTPQAVAPPAARVAILSPRP